MAINEELVSFVKDALARGVPRAQIEEVLLKAGWKQDQVKSALTSFAELDFPVPVPRPKPYLSAREAFLYLVLFTTLYISAYNLGSMFFQFINLTFPDPAAPMGADKYIFESIRWAVSSIVVAFPIFLYLAWLLRRETLLDPAKRASKVRRWLTYLTLFVTASILIGDFISLVFNFLGGELTIRFFLKVLTVAGIAGPIFAYYLTDLRSEEKEAKS